MTDSRPSEILGLSRDFSRFAGWRLWLLLALMAGGALAEGVGLLLIVPLAAIALGEESVLPAWIGVPIEQLGEGAGLGGAIALFLLAMGLRSILLYLREALRWKLQTGYQNDLQLRAAATLAAHGWAGASRIGQAGAGGPPPSDPADPR